MKESENKLSELHRTWDASCRRILREIKAFLRDNPGNVIKMTQPGGVYYRIDHIILDDGGMLNFCRFDFGDDFILEEHLTDVDFLLCLTNNFRQGNYELVKKKR